MSTYPDRRHIHRVVTLPRQIPHYQGPVGAAGPPVAAPSLNELRQRAKALGIPSFKRSRADLAAAVAAHV